jgi:protein O-GlcNAc transferase
MTTSSPISPSAQDAAFPLFQQANALYTEGDFAAACTHYRRALEARLDYPEAHNNLGLALAMQGELTLAAESYQSAIALRPNYAIAYNNYGNVLHNLGDLEQAGACYRKAIAFRPDYAEAYNNLGNVLRREGGLDAVAALYDKAISLNPNYAEAHYNLGFLRQTRGGLSDAEKSYRNAIALRPNYVDAHNNLGTVLKLQGRWEAAAECYKKALAFDPNNVGVYCNLADSYQTQGKLDDAAATLQQAIAANPDCAQAHSQLGNVLQAQGEFEKASASFLTAIGLDPDRAESHFDFGNALWEQGRAEQAAEHYRKALALNPDDVIALGNLLYLHARARDVSPEEERALASTWEAVCLNEAERTIAHNRTFSYPPRAGRKLRLGIVSAELGQHPVAEFLEPILEQLDRRHFHVSLYPAVDRPEPRALRFKQLADEYLSIARLSDAEAADKIRADQIDILLDTSGHMRGGRLGVFARRAAPVQCHYIGYHGSTGLTEMDWFIADEVLLPASYDAHFCENIWRLPRLRLAYKGDDSLLAGEWQPAADGTIWLGTFNNLAKVREDALALWARVLQALPEAKLLLKDSQPEIHAVQQRIRDELGHHGINGERVVFAPATPDWRLHMAMYAKLDIALDTLPLNSETTAFDALWMNVPVVALKGDWYGARMVGAMLEALGKPEWVARDADEYIAKVAALARDTEGRRALRNSQRELMKNSPLCDVAGLARALEQAFDTMFDKRRT